MGVGTGVVAVVVAAAEQKQDDDDDGRPIAIALLPCHHRDS